MKKLFSSLLCLLIVFGCFPVSAFAADGNAVETDSVPFVAEESSQSYANQHRPLSFGNGTVFSEIESTEGNVTVTFDPNGGDGLEPITVTVGEKYGTLPSSSVTGLSGGNGNWYLVDAEGRVTDTNITKRLVVSSESNHTLFVKRKVLAPTLKLTLRVPGAISDKYEYYVPENSARILTVTVGNRNDAVLSYAYEWFRDGVLMESETADTLTLEGNVSDTATYTVRVTATLKENSGIIVTESSASAETTQKVTIRHATNTVYYDANGGEGGPSSNFTGGTVATVQTAVPTHEGYLFDGWNTAPDGSGISYAGGSEYHFQDDAGNGGRVVTLYAQWVKLYPVFVGNVQVSEKNASDVLGDGTVSYDVESGTLTLNNAHISNAYEYREFSYVGINSEEDLRIVLIGENTVTVPDAGVSSVGLRVSGDVSVSGTGSLTVFCGSAVNEAANATWDYAQSIGIQIDGTLTLESGTVTAIANRTSAVPAPGYDGWCDAWSMGVCIYSGNLYVESSAVLNATGGEAYGMWTNSTGLYMDEGECVINGGIVNAVSGKACNMTSSKVDDRAYSYAFSMYANLRIEDGGSLDARSGYASGTYAYSGGIYIEGDIDIYFGYLVAYGDHAVGTEYALSDGIYIRHGGFYVYENSSHVIVRAGTAESAAAAYGYGIAVFTGDVGIFGGSVQIYGGKRIGEKTDLRGSAFGLYVKASEEEDGATVGGYLTVSSQNISVNSYGYGFVGTELKIEVEEDWSAVYATSGIVIEEEMTISSPENAFITFTQSYGFYDHYTVTDADGIDAKEVSVELLTYEVLIEDAKSLKGVPVPAGWSVNQAYCEHFGIRDFSEGLNLEKDGYRFGGFYTDKACTDGNEYTFDVAITRDLQIYVKWIPLYSCTVAVADGGQLFLSAETVAAGDTVTVTCLPDAGMKVVSVSVIDADGNAIPVIENADGTYSFTQPYADITVHAVYQVTTNAPADTSDTTATAPNGNTTIDSEAKSGCASTVFGCNTILLLAFGAATVLKKKKKMN